VCVRACARREHACATYARQVLACGMRRAIRGGGRAGRAGGRGGAGNRVGGRGEEAGESGGTQSGPEARIFGVLGDLFLPWKTGLIN